MKSEKIAAMFLVSLEDWPVVTRVAQDGDVTAWTLVEVSTQRSAWRNQSVEGKKACRSLIELHV